MRLSKTNYFSREMSLKYTGASQLKAAMRCEAAALAEIMGEYQRPLTSAILVGSYVDAYFEGTLQQFCDAHAEIFKRDGTLKAEFLQAEKIIDRLRQDELFMMLLSGKKQTIKTGKIAGVPFKIKTDCLLTEKKIKRIAEKFPATAPVFDMADGAIIDLKVMRDLKPVYDEAERTKKPFVEAWGYDIQGAIYQAIEGHFLPFILAAATKEDTPNLAAVYIPQSQLDAALEAVKQYAPRWQSVKKGRIPPKACGKCPYCLQQKRLTSIIDYREI